jgi:very-short-patch-repair endonuclease
MEWLKDLSDKFLIWFLKRTSGFGQELTRDGRAEQLLWRDLRRRNLHGLRLRSQQRLRSQFPSETK